jgi:hypothetical protein
VDILRRAFALPTAGLFVAALVVACGFQDAICGSGEYPVQQIDNTGRQCVAKGEEPPAGWTRYPAGQEPKRVDDEWDVYWRTHTINQHGEVIEAR